jgi:hypothetical protein
MFQETIGCNEQLLAPGEGLEHVIFHEHQLALEWRRIQQMKELTTMMEMGTARQGYIAFANDWRISAITMISDESDIGAVLHGEARRPTYEVLLIPPFKEKNSRDPLYDVNQKGLRTIIDDVRAKRGRKYRPRPVCSEEAILNYCEAYPVRRPHDPDLHGCFEFREEHWLVPEFMRNRVMIPDDTWNQFVWESTRSGGREPNLNQPYAIINEWCREHCADEFAWIGAAATWTFRNENDALAFKLRWA